MKCTTCGKETHPHLPEGEHDPDIGAVDCGGDCMQCMADFGDPDCQKEMGVYHEEDY